jgi:hypothetical protein
MKIVIDASGAALELPLYRYPLYGASLNGGKPLMHSTGDRNILVESIDQVSFLCFSYILLSSHTYERIIRMHRCTSVKGGICL